MTDLIGTLKAHPVALLIGFLVVYTLYGAIHRLYLSPIAHFPGPKLAALTLWYEFYYDVFPYVGRYTFHIHDLHQKYGPIIRINPWELHISDPEYYETLYSSTKKRDKWPYNTKIFGIDGGGFSTVEHNLHRQRRAALNPFFSGTNVRRLQAVIEERVNKCIERLRGFAITNETVRCVVMTSAYSTDVIMLYCFGRSYQRLDAVDMAAPAYDAIHQAASLAWIVKHMSWIREVMQSLPEFIAKRMGAALSEFVQVKRECRNQVKETVAEKLRGRGDLSHPTIFHELLDSKLPDEEKGVIRLADEAQTMIVAGGETVAWALAVATYHLLANPHVLQKLKMELESTISDVDSITPLSTLENLPYLTAVVKEAIRLSYGASTRLQRVPHEPLTFSSGGDDWTIPAGTPCGMTSLLIHHDELIFPESYRFKPERWIEDPRLDRYLVSFSKGSRQCLGMNLAYAEMYLWLAHVFRRFGSTKVRFEDDEGVLELVDTDISDVTIVADCFVPLTKPESKGVRFRVLL